MSTLYEPLPKEFVSKTAFFDFKTPLTQALDEIAKFGAVIVTKDKAYFGVADDRVVSRKGSDKSMKFSTAVAVGRFARKLPMLDKDMSVGKAIGYFHEFSTKAMPFGDGKTVTGLVRRDAILRSILSLHLLSRAKVSDMTSMPLLAIDADATVPQAINVMSQNGVKKLAVMDKGKVYGIIVHKDIFANYARSSDRMPELTSDPISFNKVSVRDAARTDVFSIDYGSPSDNAIRQILERNVSSRLVTSNGKPVGMVSARDVFEFAAATVEKEKHTVIITGMDANGVEEYEQDMEDEVNRFVEKMDRFGTNGVSYAAINVNKVKNKGYEMRARLGFQRSGVVFATATGYGLDSTLTALLDSLFKQVKGKKEVRISGRKGADRYYAGE
ncbi:CBS domain protein [uncultured archaeon]|nr:CBS domain protein [uncultured archaeon]